MSNPSGCYKNNLQLQDYTKAAGSIYLHSQRKSNKIERKHLRADFKTPPAQIYKLCIFTCVAVCVDDQPYKKKTQRPQPRAGLTVSSGGDVCTAELRTNASIHTKIWQKTHNTHLVTGITPTRTCILGNRLGLGCGKAPYLNDGLQAKGSKVSQYCKTEPRFSSCELVHPWVKNGHLGKERRASSLQASSKQSST